MDSAEHYNMLLIAGQISVEDYLDLMEDLGHEFD